MTEPDHHNQVEQRIVELQGACDQLTDRVVAAMYNAGTHSSEALDVSEDMPELSSEYGPFDVALGLLLSAKRIVDHIFRHHSDFSGVTEFFDENAGLFDSDLLPLARSLAATIVEDSKTGGAGTVDLLFDERFERDPEQAFEIAFSVWAVFCGTGAALGAGVSWCQAESQGDDRTDPDPMELAAGAVAIVSALLVLVALKDDALARRLAFHITEDVDLSEGTNLCFFMLERDTATGTLPSAVETTYVCRGAVEDQFSDVEWIIHRASSIVSRLGGGPGSGAKAAARLDVLLAA